MQNRPVRYLNVLNSGIYIDIEYLEKTAKDSMVKMLKELIKNIENE